VPSSLTLPPPASERGPSSAGTLLRLWREKRRLSQLAVALEAGVSSRHLSFVETGRAGASPEMILRLSETLGIPLRERNEILLAAGFAPAFPELSMTSAPLRMVTESLQRLLDAHHPYPGVALDRRWNVVLTNAAARRLMALLPAHLTVPSINMFRASLHPDGFAAVTSNFAEWGRYLMRELEQLADSTLDASIVALLDEMRALPNVRNLLHAAPAVRELPVGALIPCVITLPNARLSLFTTLATLGTPRDVTLSELTVELFYPSDPDTAALLRAHDAA
jgi:transcriptional regulator with XRE-family HTH domain